jgi:hypothetical protein
MIQKIAILMLLLIILVGCTCNPPNLSSVPLTIRGQEQSNWCWAASGEMIMDYLGVNVSQCQEANERSGRTDCCTNPNGCNFTGWPEFDKFGFTFDRTSSTALTWAQLREQIFCKRTPVAFSWGWPGGGGHMMVAYGYVTLNNVNYVSVFDPLPVNQGTDTIYTYDFWVASPGHHTHWDDFYNIRRQN